MIPQEIINLRLSNQLLLNHKYKYPSEVVAHMGAMQAQDYLGSLWAVALRTESSNDQDIEQAIKEKQILRTWPMRGTLHYVSPNDARWMLKLTAPRILTGQVKRFKREFDIDEGILNQCRKILISSLQGGKQLARNDVYRVLEEGGISAKGQRGLHIIWYLAQDGLLCFGPREGKQPSFVLLDEWVPKSRELSYEESLAEITYRYFFSRGPATLADFVWWTGLSNTAAKNGLELVKSKLISDEFGDQVYWMSTNIKPVDYNNSYLLLPSFDEYLIAYTDRSLMLGNYTLKDVVPYSNGMFFPVIVENGLLIGTWKRKLEKKGVKIDLKAFSPLNNNQGNMISAVINKYEKFLGYSQKATER